MRKLIGLCEDAVNPAALVHALRDEYVREQGKTPREINSGQCFDFAEELESRYRGMFETEGFGNFCNHDWDAGQCSDHATGFVTHWMEERGWHPPEGMDWDDTFKMFSFDGIHGWAYCFQNGLCYDIENPDGVKNVFDLAFLQRWVAGHRAITESVEPLYLRIGDWDRSTPTPRSSNFATGDIEAGLSVYDLKDGQPVVPEEGEWAEQDMRERLASDDPKYIVRGRLVGQGHDGEPLLSHVQIVRNWSPDK